MTTKEDALMLVAQGGAEMLTALAQGEVAFIVIAMKPTGVGDLAACAVGATGVGPEQHAELFRTLAKHAEKTFTIDTYKVRA